MQGLTALSWVDWYNAGLVIAIGITYGVSYVLSPHVMPLEKTKPGFLSFCVGASVTKYVRGPRDPPMTEADWPNSPGTESHNIERFASTLEAHWDCWGEQPLHEAILHLVAPFWVFTHIVSCFEKLTDLLNPFMMSCMIAYMESADVPQSVGYKLALLASLRGLLKTVSSHCHANVLALACTDPLMCGLRLLVWQKVHRLSPTGQAMTSAAQVQQAMQDARDIAALLFSWTAKSLGVDAMFCLYSLWALWDLCGISAIIISGGLCGCFGVVLAVLSGIVNQNFLLRREAEVQRWELVDELVRLFRTMRSYGWVHKTASRLEATVAKDYSATRRASLVGAVAAAVMLLATKVVVPVSYFLEVFVRGKSVSFEKGLLVWTNMMIVVGCWTSIAACSKIWFEIKVRALSIETFLRLPEREEPPPIAEDENEEVGSLEITGGSFAWPPKCSQESPGAPEAYQAGEVALWAIPKGHCTGNWVPCRVEELDDEGLYTVHVLPTAEYDSAGGAADTSIPHVPPKQLRKCEAAISGVELRPRDGELILVSGAVGAGKTSLLMALVGEMIRVAGDVRNSPGPVAFQPQVPVLLDGTIQENVFMGLPSTQCERALFKTALVASQLAVDMDDPRNTLHAQRELTAVGKDGSLLSGGQRARTALARSVYAVLSGARLAVLDDPVASVDNEVLQSAWDAAVLEAMRGATRIVAVNSQLLARLAPTADRLLLLEAGCIVYDGPPAEVARQPEMLARVFGRDFDLFKGAGGSPGCVGPVKAKPLCENASTVPMSQHVVMSEAPMPGPCDEEAEAADAGDPALGLADLLRKCEPLRDFLHSRRHVLNGKDLVAAGPLQMAPAEWNALRVQLRHLEQWWRPKAVTASGAVRRRRSGLHLVAGFFSQSGAWWFPLAAVFESIGGTEAAFTYSTAQKWDNGTLGLSNFGALLLFTLELVLFPAFLAAGGHCTLLGTSAVSANMRRDFHRTLTSLGMPYFWTQKGQAEADIRKITSLNFDELAVLGKVPTGLFQIAMLLLIPLSKEPRLFPLAVLGALMFAKVNGPREWTGRQLEPQFREITARLDLRVSEHFGSITVLRALGCTERLERATYPAMMSRIYLSYWKLSADMLVAMLTEVLHIIFKFCGKAVVMQMRAAGANASEALLLDGVTTSISELISLVAALYNPFIIQAEKYRELFDFLDTDYLEPQGGDDPPKGWPSEGQISLKGVAFSYARHLPPALRKVDFTVRPREKLGIVGRTGAGKSTLVSLLLRLGPLKGRVVLDGVDLTTLKLCHVRRAVALVPQEPTIFRMSLKGNLGGEDFTDAEVITALQQCGLDARQLTGKATMEEALASELPLSAISTGQQQLLMTARALVRRPAVLLLDECTASLDRNAADHLLRVIGSNCGQATVLSIAHRLRFVLGSDRILVLGDGGRMLALDTPAKLLEDEDGYFTSCLRHEQLEDGRGSEAQEL